MAPDETLIAQMQATAGHEFSIVLKPISNAELGDIRIEDNLFPIGRTESPFASYERDIVMGLSRRHARIFSENGSVYVADLGSKNGTSLNGVSVREKPRKLSQGDEICFGGKLSYRVQLQARVPKPRASKLVSLTLSPEHGDLGLLPIVIIQFPFLISKADETFSRYKAKYPHQVNYISRRHAHIFLKGGLPYIEDLGSTNGTFVAANRLEEHAVPLENGELLAFGGDHFAYRVSLQKEQIDPTATKLNTARPTATPSAAPNVIPNVAPRAAPRAAPRIAPSAERSAAAGAEPKVAPRPAPAAPKVAPSAAPNVIPNVAPSAAAEVGNPDKTTFVAAADSFLDIFCVDQAPQQEDEVNNEELKQPDEAKKQADKGRARGKLSVFLAELSGAFVGSDRPGMKWAYWGGGILIAVLAVIVVLYHVYGASNGELRDLLARGEYARAVTVSNQFLERHPDDAEVKTLGTEALLKAKVPEWVAMLNRREFDRVSAVLAGMKELAVRNADAQSLVSELEWIGDIQQFVVGRGGVEAPIRIYTDEEKMDVLLKRWDEDTQAHQRALARIASYVPEFKDPYAQALSHLRTLQSDRSVYLAAIERLKTTISAELNRDQPEALEAVLKEYAEKYPRLGGVDAVRQDLRQYTDLENQARARKLGPLVTLLARVKFSTPPFQAKFRTLASSNRLPSADVVRQYQAVSKAWREGDTKEAFAGLERMAAGPWGDAASKQLELMRGILERYTELQRSRGAKGYDERVLAFYGALDPEEDVYFIRGVEADVGAYKDKALKQAQDLLERAQARWREYRDSGAIEGRQRIEAEISNQFRTQARLLAEADESAQQGARIYTQLKMKYSAQWGKLKDEINAEAELQRKSLMELRTVLEPGILKAKLALLGGREGEERHSP